MSSPDEFSAEQKQYLEGFVSGQAAARAAKGLAPLFPVAGSGDRAAASAGPEAIHFEAQSRALAAGGKLSAEEEAKRQRNPLDRWDELAARAAAGAFPKGVDVFCTKFFGLFYVAPAQDSYMCRLRLPNGIVTAHQLRGIADLAERYGGPYAHVTTRANLQLREIGAADALRVLTGLYDLGIVNRGAGADNIRNVTGDATAGIAARELLDTRPLASALHHHILNHRELYGLPRKFNIAFDGGGPIAVLEDTNDIAFAAVRVPEGKSVPAGVYLRMALGGITGHGDFARDAGILLRPEECVAAAAAVVRVFSAHGDRTDRKRARMKYVLERLGLERYVEEAEAHFGRKFTRLPAGDCLPRPPTDRLAHIGFHPQRQPGKVYAGIALSLGRLTLDQIRGVAAIAERYGSGTIRLTVWQNLLISDIDAEREPEVQRAIESLGLHTRVAGVRAGLVACTGSTGCKFSASDTKRHALAIAAHCEARVALDVPVNIHLTGCHHSCAQHYVGDIGLLGTKVSVGEDAEVEGYHLYVGGGWGAEQSIAREVLRDVPADDVPAMLERLLAAYLARRASPEEPFHAFARRSSIEALGGYCAGETPRS